MTSALRKLVRLGAPTHDPSVHPSMGSNGDLYEPYKSNQSVHAVLERDFTANQCDQPFLIGSFAEALVRKLIEDLIGTELFLHFIEYIHIACALSRHTHFFCIYLYVKLSVQISLYTCLYNFHKILAKKPTY